MSTVHFHQLPTTRPPKIPSLSLIIFLIAQMLLWQKLKQLWKNFLNWSLIAPIKKYRTISKKIPVWKYKAYTVPKNTGIPGFCKNTVPYRTGIKFLIPLGPGCNTNLFSAKGFKMIPFLFLSLVPLAFAADSPNIVIVLTDDQVRWFLQWEFSMLIRKVTIVVTTAHAGV